MEKHELMVVNRDETNLTKLQQLGMTQSDENKILAMRDYILKLANATSSFSSRLNYDPDIGMSLKFIGDIELQKLGVVPQTVFLKIRGSEPSPRSSRLNPYSKRTYSSSERTSVLSPPRVHKLQSLDQAGGAAPFEDLRRRLATINGSTSSLSVTHIPRDPWVASPSLPFGSPLAAPASPVLQDRPASPTESTISTTNSVSFRPLSVLQVGSTDGQKAAPAIGSSKTNVTGLLEAHSKLRSESSPERSGRSSPMSMSTTLRAPTSKAPPLLPISTYGETF